MAASFFSGFASGTAAVLPRLPLQFSTPFLDFSFEYVVTIFGYPYLMSTQPRYGMATPSILNHKLFSPAYPVGFKGE